MKSCMYIFVILMSFSCAHKKSSQHYKADLQFHPVSKNPAFVKTHPLVCFDEGHHNLAVRDGFYNAILGLLISDGYEVVRKNEKFTKVGLKGCDVLYVSAVIDPIDAEEIKSVSLWVKEGGSLLIMTDHKPMSLAAAGLLKEFKAEGTHVSVENPKNPIAPFSEPGIFFIPESQMKVKHPIVRGRNEYERLTKIFFFYGEALAAPFGSDEFLKVGPDAVVGELCAEQYTAAAMAMEVGKGRLVVFGDGTVFTSKIDLDLNEKTGMNREGSDNIQMALNVFHWLSRIL